MIGTALAIASLAGTVLSQAESAAANKRAERELAQRRQELDLEVKYDYNLDFLNTPQAKSALSLLTQKYIENTKKVAQGSVISGASDEKTVAAAEEMQKPYVGAITSLAGYGQQRQDYLKRNQLSMDQHLADLQYSNTLAKGQNWSNLGTNALNAGIGFAQADATGAFEDMDSWFKGLGAKGRVKKI